jgi:hypothetical protein
MNILIFKVIQANALKIIMYFLKNFFKNKEIYNE